MSQPLVLKKKFDDIFEASKWTKAVDNLKKLRKDHKQKLKVLEEREGHLKINKDRGDRLKKNSMKLQDEIEDLRKQAEAIKRDMEVARETAAEKQRQAAEAAGIVNDLNLNKTNADFYRGQIRHLKNTIEELQEPDEWLKSTLARYEEQMKEYRTQREAYNTEYGIMKGNLTASREELLEKQAELGRYQAQKQAYEKKLVERAELVKQEARRHEIRGYDGDLDDAQIQEFISKLRKMLQDKDRELDRVKRTIEEELRQTRAAVNELGNSRAVAMQEKLNASQAIPKNNKKLEDIQREISSMSIDEGGKAAIEASLKDVQERLKSAEDKYTAMAWDTILKGDASSMRELEDEDRRLRAELVQCNKLAADRAQLEIKKQDIKKTQSSLDTLISTYGDQLNSFVGTDWQMDSLEREFQGVQDRQNRALDDATKQQTGTASELNQIEFQLETVRSSLSRKKEEKSSCQIVVRNSILTDGGDPLSSVDDYETELEELENERNQIRKEIDGFTYYTDFYAKCLNTVNSQNKCKLCERQFADKKERSSAMDKINKKLVEDARTELEKDLRTIEVDYQKALAARPHYDSLKKLASEITALEKDLRDFEQKKADVIRALTRHDATVDRERSTKRQIDTLKSTVNAITRDASIISEREAEVSRITSQQKHSGSSYTVDELNEQSDACNMRIKALRAKIEKTNMEKEHARNNLSSLESELAIETGKLNSAQHALDNKRAKLAIQEELRESNKQLRNTVEKKDAELDALEPKLKAANAKNEEAQQRGRVREKEVQSGKERLAETINRLSLNEVDINYYLESGGPQKLTVCQRAIKVLAEDQKRIEDELSDLTQKANKVQKLVDDSDRTKRNISDNIRYRELLRNEESLRTKIAELEERNITDDHERLSREADRAEMHHQHISAKYGPMVGTMNAKDVELAEKFEEWESSYKNAAQEYRKTHIEVETTKAAIEDLGKYEHALDNGIMKFHSIKMDQINRIAGELWQNTYQGTDVDTIMIKSDNENASAANLRRQYNYRVVMVKQDTEMDMRGRCSAGQKVLASIIIRLALAECFGANCGVSIYPSFHGKSC